MSLANVQDASSFRREVARSGGLVSDGPVESGWAVHTMRGGRGPKTRAHFWTRGATHDIDGEVVTRVVTACGLESIVYGGFVRLLGAGNYQFCAHCERVLMNRSHRP